VNCVVLAGGGGWSLSSVTDLAIEAKQWECWFGGGGVLSILQLQLPSPAAAGEGVLVSGGA